MTKPYYFSSSSSSSISFPPPLLPSSGSQPDSSKPAMALSGASPLSSTPLFLVALLCLLHPSVGKTTFSFELHHKFSDRVRDWVRSTSGVSVDDWPRPGSPEYYNTLFHHDRFLRGRNLAESSKPLVTFADGNLTLHLQLGFLHYAMVEIGTPGTRFLVALDTGSDLLWVPCQCIQCANSTSPLGIESGVYSPNTSTTGKYLPCSSDLCGSQTQCSGTNSQCPYRVAYVSANTSSSGVLVEDVLHLVTEYSQPKAISASVVFGCGQIQTGAFLRGPAPNGLFGLGLGNESVPSILARSGLIADSFSMCFGSDGFGRINFGDKGSGDQEETPFVVDQAHPTYDINITNIQVGENVISIRPGLLAVFDTGTSFTYLADVLYTAIGDSFHKQVSDPRSTLNSTVPFEYCYDISSNKNTIRIPKINITMIGGANFQVLGPIVVFTSVVRSTYCLAIVKSDGLNIIGQNFMKGHRIVFDREKGVLGWKEFDCYNTDGAAIPSVQPPAMSPTSAVNPSAVNPEDTTTVTVGNRTQIHSTSSGHTASSAFGYVFFTILSILASFF